LFELGRVALPAPLTSTEQAFISPPKRSIRSFSWLNVGQAATGFSIILILIADQVQFPRLDLVGHAAEEKRRREGTDDH
jgi:hypothetical protein